MPRYIDANAMIRKICGMKCGCERYECGYDEAGCPKVRDLETAPTVSPDEVRGVGKWVHISGFHLDHEYYPSRYKCDQCGHFVNSGYDRNYCPNCGAKMEVEGDA